MPPSEACRVRPHVSCVPPPVGLAAPRVCTELGADRSEEAELHNDVTSYPDEDGGSTDNPAVRVTVSPSPSVTPLTGVLDW